MPEIKTFSFDKEKFDQIKSYHFGSDWPVVYIIEDGREIYIGETVNVYIRSGQHYDNPERRKLKNLHIISDEEYNKSATLDIESSLIQYISADNNFVLQNGNHGLLNHNYYDRQKYQAKFEIIWEQLKEKSLVKHDLIQIKNSELFKYSPYKALSNDQLQIVNKIIKEIKLDLPKTYVIKGGPGTGKTVLATYLIKALKENKETKHFKIALVVPMTSLRKTIQKVFKNIKGLSVGMVIGPNEVTNKKYDILVVDEAHRLRRRKNITNFKSFDDTNKTLGLDKKEGTELDWILKSSKHQVFFYDINQSIRPSDVRHDNIAKLKTDELELKTQLRINGREGEKYINFVQSTFDLNNKTKTNFKEYDFKIYDDIKKMIYDIKQKDNEYGLCRIVSGYAWPWISKKNQEKHDIEIDEVKLFWNSVNQNWVNSTNAINEVGCIHTVQGYDLNYTGVIIGPELAYDKNDNKFIIHGEKYMDINGRRGVENKEELEKYIINIYKTLLTRGIKGTYVFVVNEELRKYLKSKIKFTNENKDILKNKIKTPYFSAFEMINIPLFESVGCGELMYADPNVQEMIPVRKDYISGGSKYFVLRVSGDSMNEAGINHGDLVLCRKDYHPEVGNKVVALIGDDATIKEYHRENGKVVLKPKSTNKIHKNLIFENNDQIKIQGVIVKVLEK